METQFTFHERVVLLQTELKALRTKEITLVNTITEVAKIY